MVLQPNAGQGLLILEISRSHKRRTTVGKTSLDEWSARRRDLYLTTHNTHNRQTSMPPVGFEPTLSAGERPQTHASDRAATGTGHVNFTGPVWTNILCRKFVLSKCKSVVKQPFFPTHTVRQTVTITNYQTVRLQTRLLSKCCVHTKIASLYIMVKT